MNAVTTTHAVHMDMDFVASQNLYQHLKQAQKSLVDTKTAVIIPAFRFKPWCSLRKLDTNQTCVEQSLQLLPRTKHEIRQLYVPPPQDRPLPNGHVEFFDRSENPHGHLSTDYKAWFAQNQTLEPISCISTLRYEPYLVTRTCRDVPPYPQAFSGYGKNKLVWVQQLHWQGWKFLRLKDGFVTHVPHSKTNAAKKFVEAVVAQQTVRVNELFLVFIQWLRKQVPDQRAIPMCGDDKVDVGEVCDEGLANGTPGSNCTTSCVPTKEEVNVDPTADPTSAPTAEPTSAPTTPPTMAPSPAPSTEAPTVPDECRRLQNSVFAGRLGERDCHK